MNMWNRPSAKSEPIGQPLVVSVSEQRDAQSVTRTIEVDGKEIYFKVIGPELPHKLEVYDFAVISSIFLAMRKNRPLHILGPVSKNLLRNIEEFQEAWSSWLPDYYKIVRVTAESEVEIPIVANNKQGVFAFSGGVDSTFALVRHSTGAAGRRTITPALAMLVQGFDLPLGNENALNIARSTARSILDELNVPLAVVETNWKRELCYHWDMEHIAGLAACLNQFNGLADVAVIGGDEGYDMIFLPWGSNPATNTLLSSGVMDLWTEGNGFRRSERLEFIVKHSNIAPKIRVCWENADTGRNCGTCEKCIRTQLNFRAIGKKPEGFDHIAGFFRIATIPSHSIGDNYCLQEALNAAKARGVRGFWRFAVRLAIAKYWILSPFLMAKGRLKDAIRRNEQLYKTIKKNRKAWNLRGH